jgi:hypothetical protein
MPPCSILEDRRRCARGQKAPRPWLPKGEEPEISALATGIERDISLGCHVVRVIDA